MDIGRHLMGYLASAFLSGLIFIFIMLLFNKKYLEKQTSKGILKIFFCYIVTYTLVGWLIDFIFKF